jgi:hypothetical protein
LKLKNARKDEQGEWTFDMNMGQEEVSFLVELSMSSLMKVGVISVVEQEEEQEIDLFKALPVTEMVQ